MVDKNRREKKPTVKKEENAVVLDYLSRGYVKSDMSKFGGKPIAQAIGTEQFTLLELAPKNGVDLVPKDLADMRLIFAKEPMKADKEDMEKILEFLEQYDVEE